MTVKFGAKMPLNLYGRIYFGRFSSSTFRIHCSEDAFIQLLSLTIDQESLKLAKKMSRLEFFTHSPCHIFYETFHQPIGLTK